MEADEALARALQAEEEAAARGGAVGAADARAQFAGRLHASMQTALRYESRALQAQARAVMPLPLVRFRPPRACRSRAHTP
jgi:hypothetical protein